MTRPDGVNRSSYYIAKSPWSNRKGTTASLAGSTTKSAPSASQNHIPRIGWRKGTNFTLASISHGSIDRGVLAPIWGYGEVERNSLPAEARDRRQAQIVEKKQFQRLRVRCGARSKKGTKHEVWAVGELEESLRADGVELAQLGDSGQDSRGTKLGSKHTPVSARYLLR